MIVIDELADLIARLNVALIANLKIVKVLNRKKTIKVLNLLCNVGFIYNYVIEKEKIKVYLKYRYNKYFFKYKLISKLSWRKYSTVAHLKKYYKKHFFTVISTSKGLMDLDTALSNNLGGEILFVLEKK